MTRTPLPTRRPCVTIDTAWDSHPLAVTVGLYPDTAAPGEVFADPSAAGARHGQIANILSDACVAISLALQHGIHPDDLAKSLGREPDPIAAANEALRKADCEAAGEPYQPRDVSAPASPVGAIMAVVGGVAG